jgi:hypothetical protein
MVPTIQPASDIPVFPVNVLSAPKPDDVPQVLHPTSALPADSGSAVIDGAGHSDNLAADIAFATSAAPFAGSEDNAGTGDTGAVAEQDDSDYGTDGTGSKSPSVHDIQDIVNDAGEEDAKSANSNDVLQFTMEFIVIYSNYYFRLYPLTPNIVHPVRILVVASTHYCCQTRTNRLLSPRCR